MKSNSIRINKMLQAIEEATLKSGKMTDPTIWWPINYIPYSSLFIGDFYKNFFDDYERLKAKLGIKGFAKILKHPTATWLLLVSSLRAMKVLEMSRKSRVKITLEFLQLIEMQMNGDIFCNDGTNRIWSNEQAQDFVVKTNWLEVKKNEKINELFGRLHADLLSLDEAIFWNANCSTREIHGPYKVRYKNKSAQLLVRDYYDLKDLVLEPRLRGFPYESVTTHTLYDSKVKFGFPILNDYTNDLPLNKHTLAVCGLARTKKRKIQLVNTKTINDACSNIEKKCMAISMNIEALNRNKKVLGSLIRLYYRGKVIRDFMKKDWYPPRQLLNRVEKQLKTFPDPEVRKMTKKKFYQLFDPRVD